MKKKIPWESIKADYEAKGIGVSELERIYSVGKSTIHYRITKEEWKLNKFEQEISNVVNTIQSISERATPMEVERIKPQIESVIDILGTFDSFIKTAAKINMDTILSLADETDLKTKIVGLNQLKVTFKDIIEMTRTPPVNAQAEDKDETIKIEFIRK